MKVWEESDDLLLGAQNSSRLKKIHGLLLQSNAVKEFFLKYKQSEAAGRSKLGADVC